MGGPRIGLQSWTRSALQGSNGFVSRFPGGRHRRPGRGLAEPSDGPTWGSSELDPAAAALPSGWPTWGSRQWPVSGRWEWPVSGRWEWPTWGFDSGPAAGAENLAWPTWALSPDPRPVTIDRPPLAGARIHGLRRRARPQAVDINTTKGQPGTGSRLRGRDTAFGSSSEIAGGPGVLCQMQTGVRDPWYLS